MKSVARLSLATFLVLALAGAASAIPLTLTGPIPTNTAGPQSSSNPCIIAATQCQQPVGFGYNNFTSDGNTSSYNMYSTTPTANVADGVQGTPYTVAQLTALGSTSFLVAIDVNTTGAEGETLQLFQVIINGAVVYDYIGPTVIGDVANNGNGFGDWTLGLISLAGRAPTDTVLFHAVWNNASDGGESFFLLPQVTPPSVPEPSALQLLLVGAGFLGLGYVIRKRKSATNEL
jgi:hypothetical protein